MDRKLFFAELRKSLTVASSGLISGANLTDYRQAIFDICAIFSVPVLEMFARSGINQQNLATYTSDNIHPNDAGRAMFGRAKDGAFNAT